MLSTSSKGYDRGAHFNKHLKPKIFLSSIQAVKLAPDMSRCYLHTQRVRAHSVEIIVGGSLEYNSNPNWTVP